MKLQTPKKSYGSFLFDILIGVIVLALVVGLAIVIGQRLKPQDLSNWGGWLNTFVAGLALVGSVCAIVMQARQGESSSWNIALARLGQVYDLAQSNERLARVMAESPDLIHSSQTTDPDDVVFTPQETIWLGSLFLAFEQIYVATNSLRPESRRVWRLYLRNQLNKPTIRAAFVRDSTNAKDYHHDFWRFVRGSQSKGEPRYIDSAIHSRFFDMQDNRQSSGAVRDARTLVAKKVTREDIDFWMTLYSDPEVKRQMYAPPLESNTAFWDYLVGKGKAFTVWENERRIAGFTLSNVSQFIGTFGVAIRKDIRGKRYGHGVMTVLESEAARIGYKTLRADVYCDNYSCIGLLHKSGYRKFIWLEKNL
jgi:RimJ/RimL family protein N-acetyltransferase